MLCARMPLVQYELYNALSLVIYEYKYTSFLLLSVEFSAFVSCTLASYRGLMRQSRRAGVQVSNSA